MGNYANQAVPALASDSQDILQENTRLQLGFNTTDASLGILGLNLNADAMGTVEKVPEEKTLRGKRNKCIWHGRQ